MACNDTNLRPFKIEALDGDTRVVETGTNHMEEDTRSSFQNRRDEYPDCGDIFSELDTLSTHSSTHREEKPYVCDDCGDIFHQLEELNTHKLFHVIEIPSPDTENPDAVKDDDTLVAIKDIRSLVKTGSQVLIRNNETKTLTFKIQEADGDVTDMRTIANNLAEVPHISSEGDHMITTNKTEEWEGSRNEALMVEMWRNTDVLYKTSARNHKVREAKDRELARIGAQFNMTGPVMESKMKNLRTQFTKSIQRQRMGSSQKETERTKWIKRNLDFLLGYTRKRSRTGATAPETDDDEWGEEQRNSEERETVTFPYTQPLPAPTRPYVEDTVKDDDDNEMDIDQLTKKTAEYVECVNHIDKAKTKLAQHEVVQAEGMEASSRKDNEGSPTRREKSATRKHENQPMTSFIEMEEGRRLISVVADILQKTNEPPKPFNQVKHFTDGICSRIENLRDERARRILMNEIEQVTFQAEMSEIDRNVGKRARSPPSLRTYVPLSATVKELRSRKKERVVCEDNLKDGIVSLSESDVEYAEEPQKKKKVSKQSDRYTRSQRK